MFTADKEITHWEAAISKNGCVYSECLLVLLLVLFFRVKSVRVDTAKHLIGPSCLAALFGKVRITVDCDTELFASRRTPWSRAVSTDARFVCCRGTVGYGFPVCLSVCLPVFLFISISSVSLYLFFPPAVYIFTCLYLSLYVCTCF